MLKKCVLTVLELNWNKTKLNNCYHMLTSSKKIISRRRKNEYVFKMSKNEKGTCKACKNPVFLCQICKFVGFLLPSSSWLLKLPIIEMGRRATSSDFQFSLRVRLAIGMRFKFLFMKVLALLSRRQFFYCLKKRHKLFDT